MQRALSIDDRIIDDVFTLATQGEKVREYEGRSALEEAVKSLSSPRRLHVATHGFFPEDQSQAQ